MRLYETVGDRDALAPLRRRQLRRLERGRRRAHAAGRPARDRDRGRASTATGRTPTTSCATRSAPTGARSPPTSTGARVLLEKHNAADAEACFRDVIKLDPDNPDAHVGLARVAIVDRYDGAAAREEIARALAVNPAHAGALALRARAGPRRRGLARGAARTSPRCAAPTRAIAGAARIAAAAALLLDDRAGYAAARDAGAGRPPARRRVLRVRRRGADAPPPLRRGARGRGRRRRRRPRRRRVPVGARDDAAAPRRRDRRARDAAPRLEARPLRRPHLQPAEPVREGDPGPLHHRSRARTSASGSRPPRARDHRGGRALPRGALRATTSPATASTPTGPITFELYGDPREFAVRTVGLPGDRRRRRLLRPRHHLAGAHQPRVQLGDGAGARAGARLRDRAVARSRVPRWFTEGLSEVETMRARPEWTRHDDVVALRRLAARRAAVAAVAVERVHHRAHLRGRGPHLRPCRRSPSTSSSGASASRRFATRWPRSAAASARPRCWSGWPACRARRWTRQFRAELTQRFARFDKQYLPGPRSPPLPAGKAASPPASRRPPVNGRRPAWARCAPAISMARARRWTRRARCRSRRPRTRPTSCSWRASSRSRGATPTPRSPRSRACWTSRPPHTTATTCACG